MPRCPICGGEAAVLYRRTVLYARRVVGCDQCIREIDAWEATEKNGRVKD